MGLLTESWLIGYAIYTYYTFYANIIVNLITFLSCLFFQDWLTAKMNAELVADNLLGTFL
jgi:hypothetical protein